jgi:hypothetical protein
MRSCRHFSCSWFGQRSELWAKSNETRLSDGAMCQIGQLNQVCVGAIGVASSRQLVTSWCFEVSECVVVPIFNRFGVNEGGVDECVCE